MFGIGGFELFIILVFGFLIFGPDKLPEIAKIVGKGIARFRDAQREMNDALGGEQLIDFNNPDEPFKNPVEALDRIAQHQEEKHAAKGKGATAAAAKSSSGAPAKSAAAAKPVSDPAVAKEGATGSEGAPKQESFMERKARYDRERAARRAVEEQAASTASAGAASASANAGADADAAGAAAGADDATADAAAGADATAAAPGSSEKGGDE